MRFSALVLVSLMFFLANSINNEECLPQNEACGGERSCCEGLVCVNHLTPLTFVDYRCTPEHSITPQINTNTNDESTCTAENEPCGGQTDKECCDGLVCVDQPSPLYFVNRRCRKSQPIVANNLGTNDTCGKVHETCGPDRSCCEGLTCVDVPSPLMWVNRHCFESNPQGGFLA